MTPTDPPGRPELTTYDDLAKRIDVPLLDAVIPEEEVHRRCMAARDLGAGSVTVRPADLQLVSKWLSFGTVVVGSAVSIDGGMDTSAVKVYATRDLLGRGARNIETTINLGKLLSRQFQYVELELSQIAGECHRAGATLTVNLELPALALDHRVIALKIAKRVEADFIRAVAASAAQPCAPGDLAFLAARIGEMARLDAGPIDTVEDAQAAYAAGADRFAARDPEPILTAWRNTIEQRAAEGRSV